MAKSLISSKLSTQTIKFKPGGAPAYFEVTVVNESDRFASFLVELVAPGSEANRTPHWYSLSPRVCTKKPPGDSTQFQVAIEDTPIPGFVGQMNLTVRIFSMELREEERQLLRMVFEQGTAFIPVKVELPVREFHINPTDTLDIPVRIINPSQLPINVELSCLGLDASWLIEGNQRRLQLKPAGTTETTFGCHIPSITQTRSQAYPFIIEAAQPNGLPSRVEGTIWVAAKGFMDFSCTPAQQQMPATLGWLPKWKSNYVTYQIQFDNASNLTQQVSAQIKEGEDQPKCTLQLVPDSALSEPGETTQLQLLVNRRRRWWGGAQRFLFQVNAVVSDDRLDVRHDTQMLKLLILPVLPVWMQLLAILLFLGLAWWCSWLNPTNPFDGHHAAVNSVQFNGLGDQGVSGGDDQKTIGWRAAGFFNPFINPEIGVLGKPGKSVRVVRYRPVDNNVIAAGLENGEIQLWNVLVNSKKPIDSFFYRKDDRVFALEFTKDSRSLFSGHGSGLVLQWNVAGEVLRGRGGINKPLVEKQLDFAVYAIALLGPEERNLAIAGRFNQLVLWNRLSNTLRRVPYPPGTKDDYIQSLDTSEYKPNLLVTADNQGYITLWNLQKCLEANGACEIIDRWSNAHAGKAVRSVAMSANGCYLVSAGDDGRVMLWPLAEDGKRDFQFLKGKKIDESFNHLKINSVDVKVRGDQVLVLSGSDDTQVRVHQENRLPQLSCER